MQFDFGPAWAWCAAIVLAIFGLACAVIGFVMLVVWIAVRLERKDG